MPDIYDQHSKAFANVSAFVVARHGDRIASVAFKRSSAGKGRMYCYLQIFGADMVRACAIGTGRDMKSAAVHSAIGRVVAHDGDIKTIQLLGAIRDAVTDNGASWDQDLRKAGFDVWQAV